MSGLDKIIGHINAGADEKEKAILADAKEKADKLLSERMEKADADANAIAAKAQADLKTSKERTQSQAELAYKKKILEAKQTEIDGVIDEALARLKSLKGEEYFNLLLKMVKKYAPAGDGKIKLSEDDLKNLPADFEDKACEALEGRGTLKVSDETIAAGGGFVLDYGDIEENCTFDALTREARESFRDRIGEILFG